VYSGAAELKDTGVMLGRRISFSVVAFRIEDFVLIQSTTYGSFQIPPICCGELNLLLGFLGCSGSPPLLVVHVHPFTALPNYNKADLHPA